MNSPHTDRFQQLILRWVLFVLPTAVIGYVTLRFLNFSYTALSTSILGQSLYFTAGLLIAYSLYYYGARAIITFLGLWLVYYLFEKGISRLPGEFDVFYSTARFQLYSTLFLFGWAFGFLLARVKAAYVLLFGILAVITLASISNTIDVSMSYIVVHLIPVVIYGLYMLFITPQLAEKIALDWKKSGKLAGRLALFVLMILLAFFVAQQFFGGNLKAVEKELAARGSKGNKDKPEGDKKDSNYDDRFGLMEKGDDGYRLKDTMRVNTKMSQSDRLMFCSKLESYFPDGTTPMPLYFVYHYLTKYDPVKESFVRDVNVPSPDEFDVDPANLPMYYSYTDTSMVRKARGWKLRQVIDAQVYLSENTWKHAVLGPANVFSIQTIPVEKDFQKTFLSAYKIRSFISELNNAYFVYNISANPQLEEFQEQRNQELRSIPNYRSTDTTFLNYYTQLPSGGIYDSITKLARSLIGADKPPADKVLAVRDHFLQRNENGKRIFRYTMKPGAVDDPNIPSSKMLYNFLFKTHAGYCTYYAGASLFMLRALGVPTRFTTGFATINRSDKNKGWYWFYASQAHAWTQVYFPGYGWIDFDMTIGNEDQQSAPKPDGTPPLPPPEPWLVLNGKTESVEGTKKKLDVTFKEMIYFNTPFGLKNPVQRAIDASHSRVIYDKKDTTFAVIRPGDSLILVAYKDDAKRIPKPQAGVAIERQMNAFPNPIEVDEIHIRPREKEKKQEEKKGGVVNEEEAKRSWTEIAVSILKGTAMLILLIVLLPFLYLVYRLVRVSLARDPASKADQVYRSALYRFHMAGLERETETPLEYAGSRVDPTLGTNFGEFMQVYLRLKYANRGLQQGDVEVVTRFDQSIGSAIRKKFGVAASALHYFNLLRAARFVQQPEKPEYETSTL